MCSQKTPRWQEQIHTKTYDTETGNRSDKNNIVKYCEIRYSHRSADKDSNPDQSIEKIPIKTLCISHTMIISYFLQPSLCSYSPPFSRFPHFFPHPLMSHTPYKSFCHIFTFPCIFHLHSQAQCTLLLLPVAYYSNCLSYSSPTQYQYVPSILLFLNYPKDTGSKLLQNADTYY
jgi:hypothetical protein